jgi:hypothetical protein
MSREWRCNSRMSLHRLLDAVQHASLPLLIDLTMSGRLGGVFKRRKLNVNASGSSASQQATSSASTSAATATPVRMTQTRSAQRLIHLAGESRAPCCDPFLYKNRSQSDREVLRWMAAMGAKGRRRRRVREYRHRSGTPSSFCVTHARLR